MVTRLEQICFRGVLRNRRRFGFGRCAALLLTVIKWEMIDPLVTLSTTLVRILQQPQRQQLSNLHLLKRILNQIQWVSEAGREWWEWEGVGVRPRALQLRSFNLLPFSFLLPFVTPVIPLLPLLPPSLFSLPPSPPLPSHPQPHSSPPPSTLPQPQPTPPQWQSHQPPISNKVQSSLM